MAVLCCLIIVLCCSPSAKASSAVSHPERYFHAPIGSVWHYQGVYNEREVQLVASASFTNRAMAVRTMEENNRNVIVFTETNAGNTGPTESHYHVSDDGVVYFGSVPKQLFEQHFVPYHVVKFPLVYGETYQQFQITDRNFFQDLDGDGVNEHADARAQVTVAPLGTVSVPAGSFSDVLILVAKMEIIVTMSSTGETIVTRDQLTSWFAPEVGLVKYTETLAVPIMGTFTQRTTVITEELETFTLSTPAAGPSISSGAGTIRPIVNARP